LHLFGVPTTGWNGATVVDLREEGSPCFEAARESRACSLELVVTITIGLRHDDYPPPDAVERRRVRLHLERGLDPEVEAEQIVRGGVVVLDDDQTERKTRRSDLLLLGKADKDRRFAHQ